MPLMRKIKNKLANLRYSDTELCILNAIIIFYLFYEYAGKSIRLFNNINVLPIFAVAVLKLLLIKIDIIGDKRGGNVGYLTDIIDGCMEKKINCNEIKIFSYDSQGFYHAIMGKDFYAENIVVLMHKSAYEQNKEIIQRWNNLIRKKKTNKITIKLHEYDRMIYGMTFDNSIGIFGSFKPDCIIDKNLLASTKNTYSYTARDGKVGRQLINDFNDMFKAISSKAESVK